MSLTVLSDEVIRDLLENLTHEEAELFSDTLKRALSEYSTGTQAIDDGFFHQPERTFVNLAATGTTTLFMPAISPIGHGVKVITVSSTDVDPSLPAIKPTGSLTLYSPEGSPVGFLHAQTLTAFRTALASSCLLTKRTTVKTLTVFGAGLQAYWHIRLALMLRGHTIRNVNIINRSFNENAREILKRFYSVKREVKEREGWEKAEFSVLTPGYGEYHRLLKEQIRDADVVYCCTPSTEELFDASILTNHEGRKKGRLIIAVGSYTKDMRELPMELLLQATKHHQSHGHLHYHKHATEGGVIVVDTLNGALKESGEIIDAGLEPKQLVELGELAMIDRQAQEETDSQASSRPSLETDSFSESYDKIDVTPTSSSMSTVYESIGSDPGSRRSSSKSPGPARHDSDGSMTRTSSPVSPGGLHMPSFWHHKRRASQQSSRESQKRDDHLSRWLSSGNVIYKSVGIGLMDLVVGLEVIKLAKLKGVGNEILNFSA